MNVTETDRFLSIVMMIGETQRPFTLQLIPTTIEDVQNDVTLNIPAYITEYLLSLDETRFATPGTGELVNYM